MSTTTTTHRTIPPEAPRNRGFSRPETAVLLAAPVVLILGRSLLVPFDDQQWGAMFATMAEHPTRNAIGWSLALFAAGLLAAAGLVLLRLVADQPRLAVPAAVGIVTGWAGTAAIASGGLVMGDMAKSPDRDAMVAVLTGFNEGNGNTVFLLVLTGVLGNILLAVALARSGRTSRGTAILFGVGAVGSLVAAPGPARPVALLAALLLLAAHLLVVRSLIDNRPNMSKQQPVITPGSRKA